MKKSIIFASVALALLVLPAGCGKKNSGDDASAVSSALTEEELAEQQAHEEEVAALLDTDRIYNGVYIETVSVGGMTVEEATAAVEAEQESFKDEVSITVTGTDFNATYTASSVPYTYNISEVVEEAYQVGRDITDREEAYEYVTSLAENPQTLTVTATMDAAAGAEAICGNVLLYAQRAPQSNQISSFSVADDGEYYFEIADGIDGITVDGDTLLEDLNDILASAPYTGTVTLNETFTAFTLVDYSGTQLVELGTFSTTSTNSANGNSNMSLALSKCTGTVLQPGETFQFNATVGNSSLAEGGWKLAGTISNGVSTSNYGGGVCQASTTVYGAALRSGLTIAKRGNHSIPSSYVTIGQDAAISYGSSTQDLWITNNYDTPVFLLCGMSGTTLTATFYSTEHPTDWDTIEVDSWITETIPALSGSETVTNDGTHTSGSVAAAARKGYRTSGVRIYYKDGVEVNRESISDSYYPATCKKVYA